MKKHTILNHLTQKNVPEMFWMYFRMQLHFCLMIVLNCDHPFGGGLRTEKLYSTDTGQILWNHENGGLGPMSCEPSHVRGFAVDVPCWSLVQCFFPGKKVWYGSYQELVSCRCSFKTMLRSGKHGKHGLLDSTNYLINS